MTSLSELIDQLKNIEGYVYHFLRYKDVQDKTHHYKFFIEKENILKCYQVRILVVNEGEENEVVYLYEIPRCIDIRPKGDFETLLLSTIETYQTNDPTLEYYEVNSVDEIDNKARATGYFLEDGVLVRKEFLSYMYDGNIKFREIS